jgi:hypothetical protein
MALRALKGSLVALAAGLALVVGVSAAISFAEPEATGVATAAPVATAASAPAGEYHVYSCRTPAGLVAPTEGWSSSEHPAYDPTSNTCATGGGLVAALDAGIAHVSESATDRATWVFEAPAGEVITEATLWRTGNTLGGAAGAASYVFLFSGMASLGTHIFGGCAAGEGCISEGSTTNPMAEANRVIAPSVALNSPYLAMGTYCGSLIGTSCPSDEGGKITYAAIVELFAADIVLSQSTPPTVSAVTGGLAEDPSVQGTTDVAFHAADSGSGVYEALIQVDGHLVSHTVLNENGGRCHNVGGTTDGLPAFLYPQPCPAAVSADVPFDTTGLTNGVHHLVVTVTDAAGNAATVLEREITVANPRPPGGPSPGPPPTTTEACAGATTGAVGGAPVTLTARWGYPANPRRRGTHLQGTRLRSARLQDPRLRGRYGAAHLIEGRLTEPGGTPLAGAPLEVCELPDFTGARARLLATLRTATDGDWSLALPRDLPSCTLRLDYRAAALDALPEATRTLTLTVPAAVPLHITPRAVPSEGAIRFSGRLLGGPLPAGGKQLVLEARAPGGRWLEFHVVRTGARGRFGYLYRFRLPGPAHYQFRVLSEPEADFPFAAGTSNVVGVFER